MELEFDKEIDTILRKARHGTDESARAGHLDADAVAAFAENALPEKVKALYTAHFADCGRCRKMLSNAIAWPPTEKAAAASVAAPVAAVSSSWFANLFRTPGLALGLGALVIVFAGVLGYIVLQNRNRDSNASVAKTNEQSPQGGPFVGDTSASEANANASMSNATANTARAVSNTAAPNSTPSGMATGTLGRGPETSGDTVANEPPATATEQPVASAPAPPPPADKPVTKTEDRRDADEEKAKDDKEAAKQQYDGVSREAKKVNGPNRSVGPRNQQNINDNLSMNQTNTGAIGGARAEAVTVKNAGGKKFEQRNGAWYDTAYRGQATKNVARGTEDYQKLDGGLRSIANSIGGVVVVVWKGTAYRIQ